MLHRILDAFLVWCGDHLTPRFLGYIGVFSLACSALLSFLVTPPNLPSRRTPSADCDPAKRPGLHKLVNKNAPKTGKKYVVIGTGNVGMTLIEALIKRGETDVVGFDVAAPRRTPAKHFRYVCGDVTKYEDVLAALDGADVVFATFAVIRYQERLAHDYASSHAVNVLGTEHVIRACIEQSVPVLVQTSTSHVVMHAGLHGATGLDESTPYCTVQNAQNHYASTKAQAEQLVLAANGKALRSGKGVLTTAAIRPCSGIFGASDALIAELTLRNLHTKGSEMVTAAGSIDWIHVESVVYAQLLCEAKIEAAPALIGEPQPSLRPVAATLLRRPCAHAVLAAAACCVCGYRWAGLLRGGRVHERVRLQPCAQVLLRKGRRAAANRAHARMCQLGSRCFRCFALPADLSPAMWLIAHSSLMLNVGLAADGQEHINDNLADAPALRDRGVRRNV